jgi:capsular exopolysaccharide synthesis family protein
VTHETAYEQELNFRDLAALIQRGLLAALITAALAAAGTYYFTREQQPVHQATATLILSQQNSELRNFGVSLVTAPAIDVTAYRAAATGSPVLRDALLALGRPDADAAQLAAFRKTLTVRAQDNRVSSLIHIDARDGDPRAASDAANAVATALLDWDTQRAHRNLQTITGTLEAQIAALDSQLAELGDDPASEPQRSSLGSLRAQQAIQLNSARALLNSAVGSLEVMEPAMAPLKPIAPSPLRNAALAFVLGIFLTYGVILLRDALDTRIRGAEDLQRLTGLPVLASFPKQTGQRRLPREAVGYLRTSLLFATASTEPKVIVITSAVATQGKSSVAMSLAESFVRNEHRTLLIDADLRKPVIHGEYGLTRQHATSLEAFLRRPDEDHLIASVNFGPGLDLDVIPSFKAARDPAELLSRNFKGFLDAQSRDYDVIIIDSAPILPVSDTLAIAPHATGIVLSASLVDADRRAITATLELVERMGLRMLGAVATNVTGQVRKASGYAGYGYGYGAPEETRDAAAGPRIKSRSAPHGNG